MNAKFLMAAMMLLVGLGANKALADNWFGNSAIYVNGTWYYAGNNLSWCTGAFDNTDLGKITFLKLGSQSQVYTGTDWGTGTTIKMCYMIDGNNDTELELDYYKFENNNNYFQSGGEPIDPAIIDISGLSAGPHSIAVWFKAEYNGSTLWDSNNSANYVATFSTTNGESATSAYKINSIDELNLLASSVNSGNGYSGKYFQLTNNLDYSNVTSFDSDGDGEADSNFTPIGTEDGETYHGFMGIFDGNEKTISGININQPAGADIGIFGFSYGATIKNLTLSNSTIIGNFGVGGIVGNTYTDANTIENCHVTSDVTIEGKTGDNDCYVGGIVGLAQNSTITNCTSAALVTGNDFGKDDYLGSIAGYLMGDNSNPCSINDCYYIRENSTTSLFGETEGIVVYNITLLNDDSEATVKKKKNSTRLSNYNGMTVNATLGNRTLYQDGSWNTICLPFDVTISGSVLNGATLKELDTEANSAYEHVTGYDNGTLYLNFKDATSIEAGKPYIIKWTSGSSLTGPTFENVTINNTTLSSVNSTDGYLTFTGLYAPRSFESADNKVLYLGGNNKLYYPSPESGSKMTIGAFRAVFDLKNLVAGDPTSSEGTETGQSIRAFNLNFGDEGTGISEINADEAQSANGWYTIDGRKLMEQPTKKGIYVKEGQKVMIK